MHGEHQQAPHLRTIKYVRRTFLTYVKASFLLSFFEAMADAAGNDDTSPPVASAASAAGDGTENGGGKLFFTTSDLIARINQSVAEVSGDGDAAAAPTAGGFELRRQMPDGSTRRADEADTAVADLQSKIKQTAAVLSALNAEEKMEWARQQRAEGNTMFSRGEYTEAMDVYITCLVAMDKLKQGSADKGDDSDGASSVGVFSEDIEREIQLPVLLNLALCALKLGTLRKAESFCNFALQTSLGADCPKAYFRRGRARMLMGSYDDARSDLQRAVDLLQNVNADGSKTNDNTAREAELKAVRKELQKLERLEVAARKHEKVQKKNMKRLWDTAKSNAVEANGTTPDQSISSSAVDAVISESSSVKAEKSEGQSNARSTVENKKGLYSDVQERRQFSTLRAKKRIEASVEEEDDDVDVVSPSFFQWYLSLLERCLRKALHILGDEEGARMEYPAPEDKDK